MEKNKLKKYGQWIMASLILGCFTGVLLAMPKTFGEFFFATGFAGAFWAMMLLPVLSE